MLRALTTKAGALSTMLTERVADALELTYHPSHGRGLRIGGRVLLPTDSAIAFLEALDADTVDGLMEYLSGDGDPTEAPIKRGPGRPRKDAPALSAPPESAATINAAILKELKAQAREIARIRAAQK
jgi:hypothetical protein